MECLYCIHHIATFSNLTHLEFFIMIYNIFMEWETGTTPYTRPWCIYRSFMFHHQNDVSHLLLNILSTRIYIFAPAIIITINIILYICQLVSWERDEDMVMTGGSHACQQPIFIIAHLKKASMGEPLKASDKCFMQIVYNYFI